MVMKKWFSGWVENWFEFIWFGEFVVEFLGGVVGNVIIFGLN